MKYHNCKKDDKIRLALYTSWNGSILCAISKACPEWRLTGPVGETLVMLAAECGCVRALEGLLSIRNSKGECRFNVNDKDLFGETALMKAVRKRQLIVTRILLDDAKANANETRIGGSTALHYAASMGHYMLIKKLLVCDADRFVTNDKGQPPSAVAFLRYKRWLGRDKYGVIDEEHIDCIKQFLDMKEARKQFLGWAARRKNGDSALRFLFKHYSEDSPNMRDLHGRTALAWAMERGNQAGVKFLLSKGADPHARDNSASTPLMLGVQCLKRWRVMQTPNDARRAVDPGKTRAKRSVQAAKKARKAKKVRKYEVFLLQFCSVYGHPT